MTEKKDGACRRFSTEESLTILMESGNENEENHHTDVVADLINIPLLPYHVPSLQSCFHELPQ